jgi:hypothetical protein
MTTLYVDPHGFCMSWEYLAVYFRNKKRSQIDAVEKNETHF